MIEQITPAIYDVSFLSTKPKKNKWERTVMFCIKGAGGLTRRELDDCSKFGSLYGIPTPMYIRSQMHAPFVLNDLFNTTSVEVANKLKDLCGATGADIMVIIQGDERELPYGVWALCSKFYSDVKVQ